MFFLMKDMGDYRRCSSFLSIAKLFSVLFRVLLYPSRPFLGYFLSHLSISISFVLFSALVYPSGPSLSSYPSNLSIPQLSDPLSVFLVHHHNLSLFTFFVYLPRPSPFVPPVHLPRPSVWSRSLSLPRRRALGLDVHVFQPLLFMEILVAFKRPSFSWKRRSRKIFIDPIPA